MKERNNVLGVGITPINIALAEAVILRAVKQPKFTGYITVTGVHGVMESQRDNDLKKIHNRSFLSVPDGMPMVWLGKWAGYGQIERVYGPDLMLKIFEVTSTSEMKHFLFGGGEGVVEQLQDALEELFPDVHITGKMTPPFRPLNEMEEDQLLRTIHDLKPHFIWVGLSTPKQERFMHDFLSKHPNLTNDWDHGLVMLGVGAAFDFHAGLVSQAPSWMQKYGLEWFYRMLMEPRRLWKRYLYNNPRFVMQALLQMMDIRKHEMPR